MPFLSRLFYETCKDKWTSDGNKTVIAVSYCFSADYRDTRALIGRGLCEVSLQSPNAKCSNFIMAA